MLFDFELSPAEMASLDGLATLSESTHNELRPVWSADVYGLQQKPAGASPTVKMQTSLQSTPLQPAQVHSQEPQMAPGENGFRMVMKGHQCRRDIPDVKANPFTLGGGGHQLSQCQAGCASQSGCKYITYYQSSGYCHMYRTCPEQIEAGDNAVIYSQL